MFLFYHDYKGKKLEYPNVAWTKDMMICKYEQVMSAQADPAGLTNARTAMMEYTTDAVMKNNYDGTATLLNPARLCEEADAKGLFNLLSSKFSLMPGVKLVTDEYQGNFVYDWKTETRRNWHVGIKDKILLSAAGLIRLFATMPSGVALKVIENELAANGLIPPLDAK